MRIHTYEVFLIHINVIANSSYKLSFRLFADDAKIFYTSDDIKDIESVMNFEMTRVLLIIKIIAPLLNCLLT